MQLADVRAKAREFLQGDAAASDPTLALSALRLLELHINTAGTT